MKKQNTKLTSCTLYVEGMHCASCEVLIEKKIAKLADVEKVDASTAKGQVKITSHATPDIRELNQAFAREGYRFAVKPFAPRTPLFQITTQGQLKINVPQLKNTLITAAVLLVILLALYLLSKSPLVDKVAVDAGSGFFAFVIFGLVAGTSSCAALVGGLLLSMSQKWNELYLDEPSFTKRSQPFVLFNIGRLIGFAAFGAGLGALGHVLQLSITFNALLVIAVSLVMVLLALQMLDVSFARRIRLALPKALSKRVNQTDRLQGRAMPFLTGVLTFFLPCGFTLTAQAIALASGSAYGGMLIMSGFALGTLPMLLVIGMTSTRMSMKPALFAVFNKAAGALVLLLALYNINAQLGLLNIVNFNTVLASFKAPVEQTAARSDGQTQVIAMNATSSGYQPDSFVVKAGIPLKWEIANNGNAGCANTLTAPGLIDGYQNLPIGTTVINVPNPVKGTYRFSCSMGMFTGSISVVE